MSHVHESRRVTLDDGELTTLHVVTYAMASAAAHVVRIEPEAPLEQWTEERGVSEAVSGGFAVKPEFEPLGELWAAGARSRTDPSRPRHCSWWRPTDALSTTPD